MPQVPLVGRRGEPVQEELQRAGQSPSAARNQQSLRDVSNDQAADVQVAPPEPAGRRDESSTQPGPKFVNEVDLAGATRRSAVMNPAQVSDHSWSEVDPASGPLVAERPRLPRQLRRGS
jgi:hypothetical protein